MKYISKDKIYIPPDWTGDQAKVIWEFLEEIATAIWDVHEKRILEAMEMEDSLLERAARGDDDQFSDDDFPF